MTSLRQNFFSDLLLFLLQAPRFSSLILLVHLYLADQIYPSLILSSLHFAGLLFVDQRPECSIEDIQMYTKITSVYEQKYFTEILRHIVLAMIMVVKNNNLRHPYKHVHREKKCTLFSMDCSASTPFLEDRVFSSSSRLCLSILTKTIRYRHCKNINHH